jgi:hypothetical protein
VSLLLEDMRFESVAAPAVKTGQARAKLFSVVDHSAFALNPLHFSFCEPVRKRPPRKHLFQAANADKYVGAYFLAGNPTFETWLSFQQSLVIPPD